MPTLTSSVWPLVRLVRYTCELVAAGRGHDDGGRLVIARFSVLWWNTTNLPSPEMMARDASLS